MAGVRSTGIVRKVDELGRLTIPKEIRKQMNIRDNVDSFEMFTDGNNLILRKYAPSCVFCNSFEMDMISYKGMNVCKACINELSGK
ncbi:MAG: AbrB/MazE/SpoVT family DNA-binding domain-containing protein [Clostridia bacterium]|nr:AbrB/MazE/SpoVT family DNA-binding domain-containing protein [Clostridia bacterium]